jgi:hypothetical protein
VQVEVAAWVVESEDRTAFAVVETGPHLEGVFLRSGAAGGDGFVAVQA